ncbi:Trifunctional Chorismate Mutase/Prephenate Dehydratase/Prephenate Dehydrogenase [Ectocarpus siliculosus]|uniref:Trifunctional Chorismate Mutase/Prephenate Dehydratase/Prephenate Dehydrogenase n=1 Tax=Ectocarpus siliculosus TaxID=2880 RepID=D8LBQ3_ECTSI|nr:Trifunctional Chorismate Mutase/Prephenate Dehydratase/Prephenate Dehydrogenase [Ectocarpus siliculosus]|eukprot:CBN76762.1 Trifunctional Chorismate Mutase/Prephenate Dehydratase/Prephenate Dehydrogenase [Ectocarpus siliculosus]
MMCLRMAPSQPHPTKVAFQGESGAYSEKSLRELLGTEVVAVAQESFEDAFKAVARREVEYAVIPIENSLGGSIHANYDLLLRYELYVIGEHDFRVEHCLLALPGTKREDVKKVMSHPQALAQCDNYLRGMDVEKVAMYDTAGSAKLIAEGKMEGCAAIASDLAAEAYGMEVLASNIEDDDMNFTRFLLLARTPVGGFLSPGVAAKTSIVFTLPNSAGALYKALACFSLREIDFSKIESRPTSAQLLQYLRFQQTTEAGGMGAGGALSNDRTNGEERRFQYCFYLDFLAGELDDKAQSALAHLRESAPFCRVLGSYARDSTLVGPISDTLEALSMGIGNGAQGAAAAAGAGDAIAASPRRSERRSGARASRRLKIGIIGFGKFGQFISRKFVMDHDVVAMGRGDYTAAADEMGAKFYPQFESSDFFANDLDVVVFAVSILSFEEVLKSIPQKFLKGKLVVDVLSVKMHPRQTMLETLPPDTDILCTHPMFGPESGANGWAGLPFLFDRVRTKNHARTADFLSIWEGERCKMVEMSCELHDKYAANTQFITHLMGRILGKQGLSRTPIDTQGFASALRLMETTCADSFELFYGLFRYNPHSHTQLRKLRDSFAEVERQLAAKEAYLQAKAEIADEDRRRILAEFRTLIQEAATTAAEAATEKVASTAAAAAALAAAESAVGKAAGGAGSSISNGGVGDEPGTDISDEDAAAAVAAAEAAASNSDKGVEVTR